MLTKSITKYLLIFIGTLSLLFSLIGMFLPVLPTTPFLLLTSYCYIHSSKRLYDWLINHKVLGSYIYNYMTYRAIKKNAKIGALLFLWFSLIISMILVSHLHVTLMLLAVGIGVSIHILSLKTLTEENQAEILSSIKENNS